MLAHDHATAHQLATQARAARVVAGEVQASGLRVHTDVGTQTISVGDHIETRRNDRRLTYGPDHWVHNHDRWQVHAIDQRRGTLEVEHQRHGIRITLPADYVAHHVRLAYATTIAAAQGLTVDETHVVVTPAMYRSELYTALSRGRDANHAYAVCEADLPHAHNHHGEPPTPAEVLARVAQRERPDWAAHSVLRQAMLHAEQPDVIRTRMLEVARTLQRLPDGADRDALDTYRDELAAVGRTVEQPQHQPSRNQPGPPRSRRARQGRASKSDARHFPARLLADDRVLAASQNHVCRGPTLDRVRRPGVTCRRVRRTGIACIVLGAFGSSALEVAPRRAGLANRTPFSQCCSL